MQMQLAAVLKKVGHRTTTNLYKKKWDSNRHKYIGERLLNTERFERKKNSVNVAKITNKSDIPPALHDRIAETKTALYRIRVRLVLEPKATQHTSKT